VTRAAVLEVCAELGIKTAERPVSPGRATHWQGAFLTVSTMGVVEAVLLDGGTLRRSPLVGQIREQYWSLVERESRRE
jgi:branched-subunit amino acid aminotransferase/4-amino-4-deoxychorismate lyase